MIIDYVQYAWASIRKRRVRSFLTLLGIFIGIALVVSLMSLGDGMRAAVTAQFALLSADKLSISASGNGQGPPGSGATDPLLDTYLPKLRSVNGVSGVSGRLFRPIKIEFNNQLDFTWMGSMPDGKERGLVERSLSLEAESGRLLRDGERNKIVLGANFARDDNKFQKKINVGDRVLLQDQQFTVVGILKKKGSFIIDDFILMNEPEMREMYNEKHVVDAITVEVRDVNQIDEVKASIEKLLRRQRNVKEGEEDFTVQTAEASLRQLNTVLLGVQIFFIFIALISLVVGGIGIMNTMYTSVLERTREIGIMKSVGATNNTIFLIFSIEAGFFGLAGGIIGVGAGVGIAKGLAFIGSQLLKSDLVQAKIAVYLIPMALLFAFVVGVASGTLPAYQASKLKPVDALRAIK
jgi:putative ABC transport system permease protein